MYSKTCSLSSFTYIRRAVLCFILPLIILTCQASMAVAADATLQWDPNTEPDLAGYKLYYGFQTGNYEYTIDVGNETTYTVTGLEENQPVYFVATAYNANGDESDYSREVVFEAVNQSPIADAGPDQTVDEGQSVTLSAANSSDPEGRALTYSWVQTGGNMAVEISNATSAQAGFTAPLVGMDGEPLEFELTVTDDLGLTSYDYCIVNVSWVNEPPTADAGVDQTVAEGDGVALDGLGSSDPDDGITAVYWQQISGPEVEILDPTQLVTSFTAPDLTTESASLTFELAVQDAGGLIATDTCVVNVSWTNEAPVADAGVDQTVDAGATVQLNGSGSTDPDDGIASIRWTQTGGTPVTLSDPASFTPTLIPSASPRAAPPRAATRRERSRSGSITSTPTASPDSWSSRHRQCSSPQRSARSSPS